MVRKPFKNALCLASLPESTSQGWHHCCHRRAGHKGKHRIVFRDGGVREWSNGDRDSVLTKRAAK